MRRETARFSTLFAALSALLFLGPFLQTEPWGLARERILFTLVILAGLYAASTSRVVFLVGLLLAVPGTIGEWVPVWNPALVATVYTFNGALLLYVAGALMHEIFQQRRVTVDTILGGLSVYMLMGLFFFVVYSAVEQAHPGSFSSGGVSLTELRTELGIAAFPGLIYFSFVTLTTLGYGDMTPQTDAAQHLAVAEAMLGQIFLATFVARLVAQHLTQARNDESG